MQNNDVESAFMYCKLKVKVNLYFLQNKCTSTNRQIDKLVYKLYGLTEEEIKIVEGS